MGINNLKKLCKGEYKTSPIKESLIHQENLSDFETKKAAIDFSSYIYKYKIVYGEEWLTSVQNFICILKKSNVHGTFIFDGKPPPEKDAECERRKEVTKNSEDKLFNLSVDLDIFKDTNVVSDLLKETMKKISTSDKKVGKIGSLLHGKKSKSDNYIDIDAIEAFIKKKEDQIVKISKDDIDTIKKMIDLHGAKYIQAPGEAEALAAYLYSIGEVDIVITEDTDILAYGVEVFISGVNSMTGECDVIYLSEVLETTELKFEEFRDFCIMCGCDYGNNIVGVGTATALKNIQKYKNIESFISNSGADPSPLHYESSRELFKTYGRLIENKEYKGMYWENEIDFDRLFDFLTARKCRYSAKNIVSIWKIPEIIFEDFEEKENDKKEEIKENDKKEESN